MLLYIHYYRTLIFDLVVDKYTFFNIMKLKQAFNMAF